MSQLIWYQTNMTSDTRPTPLIATSSTYLDSNYAPYKAFNGTTTSSSDGWVSRSSSTGYIQIYFGESIIANRLILTMRATTTLNSAPKNFQILGSENGSSFDVLGNISNQSSWSSSEQRTFDFENKKAYSYYRINITANNGNSTQVTVGETLFGYLQPEKRVLLLHEGNYYGYNLTWNNLGTSLNTIDILNNSTESIDINNINEFESLYNNNWEAVLWNDTSFEENCKIQATPYSQILPAKNSIQLTGVESAKFKWTATGVSRVALSVDDGVTYHALQNGIWVDVTNDMSNAMTASEYSNMTWEQYKLLAGDSNFLKHQYYIPDNSEVDDILIVVELMGTNRLANTTDYSTSYNQSNKTITINIKKSGTFFANVLDI